MSKAQGQQQEQPMEATPTLDISLPVYEFVRDLQLQHGLKYDDHRQYRSYCSRRIHRIRRSLNVRQGVASSAKARHQRARKLLDVSNAMVLEAGEKEPDYAERMLVIPLCLAERAWSYAMQLKQEVSECPRRRFHLVRRLEKAAQHASRFDKLCHDPESPCSERTKKEATAYAAYMNGLFKMERENWAEAKEDFQKCLNLYTTLSLSCKRDNFVEQYRLRIDELKASLRYCIFTLGEKPKEHKVKLPATLQFHDIAFKHAQQVQQQEQEMKRAKIAAKKAQKEATPSQVATAPVAAVAASPSKKKKEVPSPAKVSPAKKASPAKAAPASAAKGADKRPPVVAPAGDEDEDEEDEFEETREAMDEDEEQSEEETDESDSDDEGKQEQTRGGGVTGLVKGWLGGAWS